MVVGVHGLVGHRVLVQLFVDCHSGKEHVLARPRLHLGETAMVNRLINGHVPVTNNFSLDSHPF